MSQEIIDEKVLELIDRSLLEHPDIGYVSLEGRIRLRKELFNAVRRMDVLSDLLEDDSITEIMINGYDQIFVEKDGRIQSFSQSFESEDRLACGSTADGITYGSKLYYCNILCESDYGAG